MVQVLRGKPTFGEMFGQGLSTGLSTGLQKLTENKLNQYAANQERQRYAAGLAPVVGNEAANFIANLNPEERKYGLQNIGSLMQLVNQQPGQQAQLGQPGQPGMPQSQQGGALGQLTGQPVDDRFKKIEDVFTPEATKIRRQELELKKGKQDILQSGEKRKASKDVREYAAPFVHAAEGAEDRIKNYNIAIKGAKSGNLRPGAFNQVLDKIGLHGLGQNQTQAVVDKALETLALNSSSAFGPNAKITNYLEQVYKRTLPTLYNEPSALVGISEINKLAEELKVKKTDIVKDLIKEWKGEIPEDADFQVRDRLKPEQERTEKEVYRIAGNMNALASGLGEEQDTLPAPEKDVKYYVSDLGTNVYSPDGKSYIREDNGQPFDWQQYNQGVK